MNSRMPLIDALKGLAAQLIVIHHLASYGPLAEAMNRLMPAITLWIFEYGRMAVQVFLVVAGFLAARGLAPNSVPTFGNPLPLVWARYVRLVRPFMMAMLLAIAGAAIARLWMQNEAIPNPPGLWQFIAHGLLLHGLFDVPSLSVGVWYVAIDFQLYAVFLILLWMAGRVESPAGKLFGSVTLVAAMASASLFFFNLNDELDAWGIYFFGSYALGVMGYWAADSKRPRTWLVLLVAVGLAALLVDFRLRIALALATALLLGVSRVSGLLGRWPDSAVLGYLGRISYSVFLVHFPVCLIVNAIFERFTDGNDFAAYTAVLLAWSASTLAGGIFYRFIESRRQWWPVAGRPAKV
ncbi:MAG: hypothetical protein QG660_2188 [Pseudomonadota bacterium]|nr:hypothetical protein [Pseudomonadota bacterium]